MAFQVASKYKRFWNSISEYVHLERNVTMVRGTGNIG